MKFQDPSIHGSELCYASKSVMHGCMDERTRSNMPLQLLWSWGHKYGQSLPCHCFISKWAEKTPEEICKINIYQPYPIQLYRSAKKALSNSDEKDGRWLGFSLFVDTIFFTANSKSNSVYIQVLFFLFFFCFVFFGGGGGLCCCFWGFFWHLLRRPKQA